ncbi:MAG: hypothetical protein ACYC3I_11645, partial [Gemmataceae bacterium]
AEITAMVCRLRLPILEVPISYRPRSAAEGKKIRWRDAWSTVWTLLRWCFLSLPSARRDGSVSLVGKIPTACIDNPKRIITFSQS